MKPILLLKYVVLKLFFGSSVHLTVEESSRNSQLKYDLGTFISEVIFKRPCSVEFSPKT